ncbi:MAG: SMP-30/gluconolactonase/LRE family protein [Bradymonadia bacterium]
MKRLVFFGVFLALVAYLAFWPVSVDPVSWSPAPNPGYSGPFEANDGLAGLERLPIAGLHGPEDIAIDREGRVYISTEDGTILRAKPDGTDAAPWVSTGGRPLGIEIAPGGPLEGHLFVADAYKGLLSISPDGTITTRATEAGDLPILYADDLDITREGHVYFSDASTKFGAMANGGTLAASKLDILEHGGHGRLLLWRPGDSTAEVRLTGLQFANGVAINHDESAVLVNETGSYQVVRHLIAGPAEQSTVVLTDLPCFPDNISRGSAGQFWLGCASPRRWILDATSQWPRVRASFMRLPAFMRPKPGRRGHVMRFDETGRISADLQDVSGGYALTTGLVEGRGYWFVTSLTEDALGRLAPQGGPGAQ